jgi:hypothetical protein
MSKISQDFINNLGSLYEQIHVKDQDFLNEESEFYDKETAELVEDIILSLSLSMLSEGYTAETFVKFLANSEDDIILEKYLNIDVNFISEEIFYNEFVEEQLELLEVAGLVKLLGKGVKAAAKGISSGAKATQGAVKTGVTKAATAGVDKRIGKQFVKSSDPSRTTAAVERLAKTKAAKSGITVPQGKLSPKQSTELIKQAKTAQAIKGTKTAAKGAMLAGGGVLTGYVGAKLAGSGGGKDDKVGPKIVGPKIVGPKIVGPKSSSPSGGGGGSNSSGGVGGGSSTPSSGLAKPAPAKPKASEKAPEGETPMQKWARLHPKLASKVKPGQSGYEEISKMRDKPSSYEKKDQTPTTGPENAKIDVKSVEADIKAETERLQKKLKNKETQKEAFDIVIEYLINYGHAENIGEACYIMTNMNANEIDNIVNICFG